MKIGWLVWTDADDEFPMLVSDSYRNLDSCYRKVRVVYAEIIQEGQQ